MVVNFVGIKFSRISNKVPTDYLRHLRSEKRNIPIYLCNDNDNDAYLIPTQQILLAIACTIIGK